MTTIIRNQYIYLLYHIRSYLSQYFLEKLKEWRNNNTRLSAKYDLDSKSPENVESVVKDVIHKIFELEFIHGTNVYQVSKRNVDSVLHVREKRHESIDVTLGVKEKREYKLGNYIPSSEAKNILIVTRGRSGSTFTFDLID